MNGKVRVVAALVLGVVLGTSVYPSLLHDRLSLRRDSFRTNPTF